ncbi:MAG: OmpA family protein, partial [Candidatus Acidiferrales bacterium]
SGPRCPLRRLWLLAIAAYAKSRAARRDDFHPDERTRAPRRVRHRRRSAGGGHGDPGGGRDRGPGQERSGQVHHALAERRGPAAARQQAELDKEKAELEAQQQSQARALADAKAQQEQQAAAQAQQAAAQAQAAAARSEQEKEELRANLLQQFSRILPTTDTSRGLKVNMADVLFDTAKYDLQPAAREALAKLSGIVEAHPGLKLQIEGYTDSVGSDAYNQTLSESRASSVRAYLVSQGVDPAAVTSIGYGKSNPVASNDSVTGRKQNRRVEIIISGEVIGTQIGGGNPPPSSQQ